MSNGKTIISKITSVLSPKTIAKNGKKSAGVNDTRTYLYEKQTQNLSDLVFADGIVTIQEMQEIKLNHEEIIRDFLCACDLLEKMEKEPQKYSTAEMDSIRFVVEHLMRAREKSYAIMEKASFYNDIPPQEKQLREKRKKSKEKLDIKLNLYEIFALDGNAHKVIQTARKQEKKMVMTPEEIEKTEQRIKKLIKQLTQYGKDEKRIFQFLNEGRMQKEHV